MTKGTVLRLSAIGLVATLALVLLWNASPKTLAQKYAPPSRGGSAFTSNSDNEAVIYLNAVQINAKSAYAQSLRTAVDDFAGRRLHLVRFQGPIQPDWPKMLTESGAEIVDYIPNYTYLVYGDSTSLQKIQTTAAVAESPTGSASLTDQSTEI